MSGALILVAVLLLFPVMFLMGMTAVAAGLGTVLEKDAVDRHADSELLELNV